MEKPSDLLIHGQSTGVGPPRAIQVMDSFLLYGRF